MYLLVDAYYSENGGDVIVDIVSRLCRRCRTFFWIRDTEVREKYGGVVGVSYTDMRGVLAAG